MFQDLGSNHLPIPLTTRLSPVFRLNKRSPSFNFQKVCWDDFAFYFDFHCPSAKKYLSLCLSSSGAAFFISLTLNAAKFSIHFDSIKREFQNWWSAEVEEPVSKRRKAFAAAHRSDEYRQVYIRASRHLSPVIAKAKAEAWQAT